MPAVNKSQLVAQNTQTPAQTPKPHHQVGFLDQRFEPSPLDELSKLVLTPDEQNVSDADVLALEQAKHNVNFTFTINPLIQQYINFYQGRGRSTMESGLRRSGQYMKLARQIFAKEGVPVDITWLGQVESAWKPKAIRGLRPPDCGSSFPVPVAIRLAAELPGSTSETVLSKRLRLRLVT